MRKIILITIGLLCGAALLHADMNPYICGTFSTGAGGGGISQSFEYLQSAQGTTGASPRTVQLTGVQAGSLIVVWVPWLWSEETDPTVSDGTSSFTAGSQINQGWSRGQFFYILSSVASGAVTYTATASGCNLIGIQVWEFSHTQDVALDVQNTAGGSGTTATSGAITTTATPSIVLGGVGEWDGNTLSNPLLNGEAASAYLLFASGYGASSYKIFSAGITDAVASWSISSSSTYACCIISFK